MCLQVALALLTGALHGLPWLFEDLFWCSWLGIALGLFLVTRPGWIASWWMTWLWSTLALTIAFHWSPGAMAYTLDSNFAVGLAVAVPFLIWDGLRLALGYWLAARLTRDVRLIWIPAALLAMTLEWVMPSVFPWRLGLPQLAVPWLVQPVAILGAGWTTLIAFTHAGLILLLLSAIAARIRSTSTSPSTPASESPKTRPRTIRLVAFVGVGLLAGNALFGFWSMADWRQRMAAADKMRFALVQVDPSFTWSTAKLQELTRSVADRVDMVCWPESSGGNYELGLDELSDPTEVFGRSRAPERGLQPWPKPACELLLGGKCYVGDPEDPEQLHVTAMLINAQEKITARYHKRFLMPFGEYVPGEETVPGMAELFDMAEHVQPGQAATPIKCQAGAILGATLCYEDMVPLATLEMTNQHVNVLISLINGSAFESPYTLTQHRLLSQLRAVECRKFLLRCAATGETCSISPLGEIVDRLPVQQDGVLIAEAALLPGSTQFTRTPWLGPLLTLIGLVWVSVSLKRRALNPNAIQ